MKIGIDALPLLGRAGIRVYQHYLLKHLFNIDHENHHLLFFRAFKGNLSKADYFSQFSNVAFHKIPVPNRILKFLWTRNNFYLPFTKKFFRNIDIYFSTIYFSPTVKNCPEDKESLPGTNSIKGDLNGLWEESFIY